MALDSMLRVFFPRYRYALSDPMAERTLSDGKAMHRFAGIELGCDPLYAEQTSTHGAVA